MNLETALNSPFMQITLPLVFTILMGFLYQGKRIDDTNKRIDDLKNDLDHRLDDMNREMNRHFDEIRHDLKDIRELLQKHESASQSSKSAHRPWSASNPILKSCFSPCG